MRIRSLLEDRIIERTLPGNLHNRLQRYRLTAKGRALAAKLATAFGQKSNRARIAPIAPNAEQGRNPPKNKGNQGPKRNATQETTKETSKETSATSKETSKEIRSLPIDLSDAARLIAVTLLQNPTWTAKEAAKHLGLTQQGVQYHIVKLAHILHHEGPTKKGRWVFGPKPRRKWRAK